jgi:organic radical activating enzyme
VTGAEVIEIFSSVQGEGLWLGERQIFLRLAGCNLSCPYCDTPRDPSDRGCRVEWTPGRRDFRYLPNPLTNEGILDVFRRLDATWGPHHFVSITGGEPLLQVDFLTGFLPALKGAGFSSYLETNGTLPVALGRIVEQVDRVSMDFKLPFAPRGEVSREAALSFLAVAAPLLSRASLQVKVVVTRDLSPEDVEDAAALVASVACGIPLILQPVTPAGPLGERPDPAELLRHQSRAAKILDTVRIIPQVHRCMGLL